MQEKSQKRLVNLGTGIYAEVEQHTNKEMPRFYPERIINMGSDILGLVECHDSSFVPTEEAKAKLEARIKACHAWCYLHILPRGRERD